MPRKTFLYALPLAAALALHAPAHAQAVDAQQLIDQARTLEAEKRYDEAMQILDRVAAMPGAPKPLRAAAQYRRGWVWFRKGDRPLARKAFLQAAENNPDVPRVAAESYLRLGYLAIIDKDYSAALEAYGRAARDYREAADARPVAAEAQIRIGFTHIARKASSPTSAASARAAFESVVRDFGDQTDWAAEAKMQLVGLTLEDAMAGKVAYARAQAEAEASLAEHPTPAREPNLRLMRAEALYFQRKLDDAIAEIAAIQAGFPDCGQPAGTSQLLLAQCYDAKRDYARAAVEYQKFVDAKGPSYNEWEARPAALYGIAMCRRAEGYREAATAAFDRLRKEYPNSHFAATAEALEGGQR